MGKYVLAQAYAGVQHWNADKSDLVEVRRQPGEKVVEIASDIPDGERDRLLKLGAIVEKGAEDEAAEPPAPEFPDEPAGNASRDDWAAYAESLGLTVGIDPETEKPYTREGIKQLVEDSRS